ncbi:GNAT family N-acetyltransferase [Paenibacillus dakarensis]|uniref:GNAT family N-acetyltransferase n=1 Tax=Paenibacillus dakarensis TaxID=1527293 RepID=UPI0006D56BA3
MLIHTGTITLQTDRLVLRQFKHSDAKVVYQNMTSDCIMTKYLSWNTHESLEEMTELLSRWISKYEDTEYYRWAIEYLVPFIFLIYQTSHCDVSLDII